MFDDLAGKTTGQRIKTIRERRGMTRETLAGMVGHSAEWLKGIENGRRLAPRLPVLVRLAEMLGIADVAVLAGDDMNLGEGVRLPITSFRRIPHESVPAIREAVHAQFLAVPDHPMDIGALSSRVFDAWGLWHSSPMQRTDVGRVLPALIRDARVAVRATDGNEQRTAYRVLADVYALCEQLLAWVAEPELVWIVADRGIEAAQEADQPESIAGAAWVLGNVRRAVGDYDGAVELIEDAVSVLRPRLADGPETLRGLWGSLNLHAAISCARAGREGDAWRYWDEGDAAVSRLPEGYHHPWTQFGASNVAVHAVSIGTDLTRSGTARERAEQIDPETIPSLERRSRLMIETGRSYHQRRDYSTALDWLRRAYGVSSENVHFSPLARQMASEIIDHAGPMYERDARTFGRLLQLPA
jgi:transcriptional regulator with XRE-family HTH domain